MIRGVRVNIFQKENSTPTRIKSIDAERAENLLIQVKER